MPVAQVWCRVCKFKIYGTSIPEMIQQYLVHMIQGHWDILEAAHEDPELVQKAQAYAQRQGWV